jgi:hypothetical protein
LAYFKEVKGSVAKYKKARDLRREAFGPTLSDTLYDIGKTTVKTSVKTVKNSKDKFKEYAKKSESKTVQKMISWYRKGREFAQNPPKLSKLFIGNSDLDKEGARISRPLAPTRNRDYTSAELNHLKVELEKARQENEILRTQLNGKVQVQEQGQTQTQEQEKNPKQKTNQNQKELKRRDKHARESEIPADTTEFAKFYHECTPEERRKVIDGYNQNKSYEEILDSSRDTFLGKYGGSVGLGVTVFWQTLRDGDSLKRNEMVGVMRDVDTISNIDSELAELNARREELMSKKTQLEDKYTLVTPKQRVKEHYEQVLSASEKMIEAQIDDALVYKQDTSVYEENLRLTRLELDETRNYNKNRNPFDFYEEDEREDELKKDFVENLEDNLNKKGGLTSESKVEEIYETYEKDIEQENFEEEVELLDEFNEENEVEFSEDDFAKQIAVINENVNKRNNTRDWSIKH